MDYFFFLINTISIGYKKSVDGFGFSQPFLFLEKWEVKGFWDILLLQADVTNYHTTNI